MKSKAFSKVVNFWEYTEKNNLASRFSDFGPDFALIKVENFELWDLKHFLLLIREWSSRTKPRRVVIVTF